MIKIVAVSYLNTTPFIFGIQEKLPYDIYNLSLKHPADCAKTLTNGNADIGLVPVAVIPLLDNYEVVTDFCISCNGKVDTVCLFSDVPLNEIDTIFLDYQSKTSVNLIRILASEHWKINPKWEQAGDDYINKIKHKTAGLVIGDRTFLLKNKYKYVYDLGEEWKNYTQLPFVFACWVAKKNISKNILEEFSCALKYGIEHKNDVIDRLTSTSNCDASGYLKKRILFTMDAKKHRALTLFLNYLSTPLIKN